MRWILPVTLGLVLLPGQGSAQTSRSPLLGFGVGVNSNLDIRVPLRIATRWRLEPSLGLLDRKVTYTTVTVGAADQHSDYSQRYWRFAVLLGRLIPIDSTFTLYAGPRLALLRTSQTQQFNLGLGGPTEFSVTTIDKEFALVTGAEAALGRHFSAGGEVALSYTFGGHPSFDRASLPAGLSINLPDGGHTLTTSAAVVVRWFVGHTR